MSSETPTDRLYSIAGWFVVSWNSKPHPPSEDKETTLAEILLKLDAKRAYILRPDYQQNPLSSPPDLSQIIWAMGDTGILSERDGKYQVNRISDLNPFYQDLYQRWGLQEGTITVDHLKQDTVEGVLGLTTPEFSLIGNSHGEILQSLEGLSAVGTTGQRIRKYVDRLRIPYTTHFGAFSDNYFKEVEQLGIQSDPTEMADSIVWELARTGTWRWEQERRYLKGIRADPNKEERLRKHDIDPYVLGLKQNELKTEFDFRHREKVEQFINTLLLCSRLGIVERRNMGAPFDDIYYSMSYISPEGPVKVCPIGEDKDKQELWSKYYDGIVQYYDNVIPAYLFPALNTTIKKVLKGFTDSVSLDI